MAVNPNEVATKHDIQLLQQDVSGLKQEIVDLRQDIDSKFAHYEDRMVEKMRDMQTEVLRAFHDWARSMETRTRVLPLHEERLFILEDRVSRLERGERPPQQP